MDTSHQFRHKRIWILALFFCLALTTNLAAQDCGTVVSPAQVQIELARQAEGLNFGMMRLASIPYEVPLAIHIVRRTDGTGGFTPAALDTAMVDLNMQYSQVGWTLHVLGDVDYIDSDYFYNNTNTSAVYDELKQVNPVPWSINIYFAPNTGYCGISAFTTSAVQGILIDNACAGTAFNNSTFAHEVGHYFDLYHTHEPAWGDECPDGSNCSTAGDLLCDTPADPTLTGLVNTGDCSYIGGVSPPIGCGPTPYNPDPTSLMSYSTKLCRDLFTPEQIAKMIWVMENIRSELSVRVDGLSVIPAEIDPLPVVIGLSNSAMIRIHHDKTGSAQITGVTNSASELTVTGAFPGNLTDTDSLEYTITYDATDASSQCNIGTIYDTLRFTTTSALLPTIEVPVAVILTYLQTSQYNFQMGNNCLSFVAPNTAGFGNQQSGAFAMNLTNALYDGSLLIGLVDGTDTVVYRDAFGDEDYGAVDSFTTVVSDGRVVHTLRMATADGRLHGNITYDHVVSGPPDCQYVIAEYELSNLCDTTLTLTAGIFADFDVANSGSNWSEADAASSTIWVSEAYSNEVELDHVSDVVGITMLSDTPRNLRALGNPQFVYPTNGLVPGEMFLQMVAPNNQSGVVFQDWSALLTLGLVTIEPGNSITWTAALLYSNDGLDELMAVRTEALNYYNGTCCVGVVGNVNVDPEEVVDIGDLTRLINYLFITFEPLECEDEANMNAPEDTVVDIGDLTRLITYLFVPPTPTLPPCP